MFFLYIACLASITSGAQYAWTSPFIVKIINDKVNYNITEEETSYFVIIHPLSTITFSLLIPSLNNYFGRKYGVILIAAPQVLYWILTAVAKSVYVFYIARVASGLADALHFGFLPMYLGEISTPSVRGKWANIVFFVILGQFLINLIGQYFSVWHTSIICLVFPVLFLVVMPFMPESPYYCAMMNKDEEGKRALRFLRGKTNIDSEFSSIKADIERQMSEQGTWKELFSIRSNRKAVIAAIFLRISQQFSGISVYQSYNQFIFEKSGSHIHPGTASVITIGLLDGMTFVSGYIAEIFGRKKSFMYSMLACAIMLLLQSTYFYVDQNTTIDVKFMNWFPLLAMVLYIIFSSCGVSNIPTLMLGELFSNSIKTKGLGVNVIVLGLGIFINNGIFYILVSHFGIFSPFFFFGICSLLSTVMSVYLVPETKGKTLEEIQQDLKGNKKEIESSHL